MTSSSSYKREFTLPLGERARTRPWEIASAIEDLLNAKLVATAIDAKLFEDHMTSKKMFGVSYRVTNVEGDQHDGPTLSQAQQQLRSDTPDRLKQIWVSCYTSQPRYQVHIWLTMTTSVSDPTGKIHTIIEAPDEIFVRGWVSLLKDEIGEILQKADRPQMHELLGQNVQGQTPTPQPTHRSWWQDGTIQVVAGVIVLILAAIGSYAAGWIF